MKIDENFESERYGKMVASFSFVRNEAGGERSTCGRREISGARGRGKLLLPKVFAEKLALAAVAGQLVVLMVAEGLALTAVSPANEIYKRATP